MQVARVAIISRYRYQKGKHNVQVLFVGDGDAE